MLTKDVDKDEETLELSSTAGGNVKWYYDSGKQLESSLQCKTNIFFTYSILGIYPRDMKAKAHESYLFIATLSVET